jgi:adenylate cyclase class 2
VERGASRTDRLIIIPSGARDLLSEVADAFGHLLFYGVRMEHAIIEFKARCRDHARIREILKTKNAQIAGDDHQVDTYFHVPHGRLKLREGNIENSLVFYLRPNQAGPKQSDVTTSLVPAGADVKAVLAKALGVMVAVDKRREIYFVGNVKVHLDCVAGLGDFVEVEAIGEPSKVARLREQCENFLRRFGVSEGDLVEGSYSDMPLAR